MLRLSKFMGWLPSLVLSVLVALARSASRAACARAGFRSDFSYDGKIKDT